MSPLARLWPLCLLACASSQPSPFFGDERYLRFGVEPDAEARALSEQLERAGRRKVLELRGKHFTALGFVDAAGAAAEVRVVTARGIALARDSRAADALQPALRYQLLEPPRGALDHDADGDGFEEVFVRRTLGELSCIEVHRVRDVGFVDPVALLRAPLDACPDTLGDVDGDGLVELLLAVATPVPGLRPTPLVRLPLFAREHRYARLTGDPRERAFLREERESRRATLTQTARQGDVGRGLALAVELATLERFGQAPSPAVLAAFDQAVSQLSLGPEHAALAERARALFVRQGPGSDGQAEETEGEQSRGAPGVPQPAGPEEL